MLDPARRVPRSHPQKTKLGESVLGDSERGGGLTNPLLINILHSFLARANEVAQVFRALRKPCGLGSSSVYCFLGFALKGLVFVSSWFGQTWGC